MGKLDYEPAMPTADCSAPRRMVLLYGTGGGGHKASADALAAVLLKRNPTWDVRLVNVSDVLGAEGGDQLYNMCMERNLLSLIPILHFGARVFQPLVEPHLRARFAAFWEARAPEPDAVVSMVPFINSLIVQSMPHVPCFTVLTDFTHSAGHPWLQHECQIVFCGTDESYKQALAMDFSEKNLIRTTGMVVHPRFYERVDPAELRALRRQLGLVRGGDGGGEAPGGDGGGGNPVALLFFGGVPPTAVARRLCAALLRRDFAVLALCGKNETLYRELAAVQRRYPEVRLAVQGFTTAVPLYMQLCDVVVGKPGPGVVSEALVSQRPLILLAEDGRVMDQERVVMEWVQRRGVGVAVHSVSAAANVSVEQLEALRVGVRALQPNRAVFEVASVLEKVVPRGAVLADDGALDHQRVTSWRTSSPYCRQLGPTSPPPTAAAAATTTTSPPAAFSPLLPSRKLNKELATDMRSPTA